MAVNPIKHKDIIQPGNPAAVAEKGLRDLEKVMKLNKQAAAEMKAELKKVNVSTKA